MLPDERIRAYLNEPIDLALEPEQQVNAECGIPGVPMQMIWDLWNRVSNLETGVTQLTGLNVYGPEPATSPYSQVVIDGPTETGMAFSSHYAGTTQTWRVGAGTGSGDLNLFRITDLNTPIDAIVISPGGKVGIGTSYIPASGQLQVVGPNTTPSLVHQAPSTFCVGVYAYQDLAFCFSGVSPYAVSLQARNNNQDGDSYPIALNPLGGNVGVGNANPIHALDVTGDINCSGQFMIGGTPHKLLTQTEYDGLIARLTALETKGKK